MVMPDEDMQPDVRKRFDEAVRLKEAGKFEVAEAILVELSKKDPKSTAILAILGDLYWDMQLLEDAVDAFRRATAAQIFFCKFFEHETEG